MLSNFNSNRQIKIDNKYYYIIYVNNLDYHYCDRNSSILDTLGYLFKYCQNDFVTIFFVGLNIVQIIPFITISQKSINYIMTQINKKCDIRNLFSKDKIRIFTEQNFGNILNKKIIYINFDENYIY